MTLRTRADVDGPGAPSTALVRGERDEKPTRRVVPILVSGVLAILVGVALGAAGFAVFSPGRDIDSTSDFVLATVEEGEVASTITLNTVAAWDAVPRGVNRGAGVVTSIAVADGTEAVVGSVLYSLDLRPVVVARGSVPSFRDLSNGATGQDVVQLQEFLAHLELYSDSSDGRFGPRTATAVKAWQRQLGVAADGIVRAGDLIYLPALPIRVVLDREVLVVGGSLSGGETVLSGLSDEPTFTIPISDAQVLLLDPGTRVEIAAGDAHDWTAIVDEITTNAEGETFAHLVPADGDSICAPDCGVLSPSEETLLTSQVIVVEPVVGLRLPTAAVQTRADQSTFVTDAEGEEHDVVVVASARGMSVVEGVAAGLSVRVLGARE